MHLLEKAWKKIGLGVLTAIAICAVSVGCSKNKLPKETEKPQMETTMKNSEPPSSSQKAPTIPTTPKEEEELFGKVDKKTGKWIPPEGSYTDPKTRNILNKEGVVIGQSPDYKPKPNPNAVG